MQVEGKLLLLLKTIKCSQRKEIIYSLMPGNVCSEPVAHALNEDVKNLWQVDMKFCNELLLVADAPT
jgi:hypothetical protein